MSSEAKIATNQAVQTKAKESRMKGKMKEHGELMAAILSGLLIFGGWLLNMAEINTASIILYILAFCIGGFAKAKEGLEATIKEKELNVELLMFIAAVGSAIIGYWTEGAILIFIFALSGALETYTMNRSNKEISSLMELQPEEALLVSNGEQRKVDVSELEIGNVIFVKPGERVPADGVVVKGGSAIDESAITGESMPIQKNIGDEVFTGTVNITGSMSIQVTKLSVDTIFQKIINLVQTAQSEKSPSQLFIERFEGTYVKVVLSVVALMMILPHFLFSWSWQETFYRAMVLLVVASPCALVASIMPATLSAISNGARNGILFKGGVHLENLGSLKAIAFDKTGTITRGTPEVTDFIVVEEEIEREIKQMAASIECHSNHPLAKAIVRHVVKSNVDLVEIEGITDVLGFGIEAIIQGDIWKIGKADFVNLEKNSEIFGAPLVDMTEKGKTMVYIQKNEKVIALVALKDILRSDAKKALQDLNSLDLATVMITGDNEKTARAIAKDIKLSDYISDCLPENKVEKVKELKKKYKVVAMVGDGVNDAPALATASVGIAMGEGTDVALETADVVLMKNELLKIPQAIQLSKKMNRIIKQNICFSILVIMVLISSNFLQVLDLPLGVIGHEGSTILVILNGLRLLKN
ncbi:heavy metal translocating P-type ATPase [Neobacillus vireti]|uniref:Cadmium-transporting ATPase n=1 Tax=Neobacillus vireti LMG 21834 TaxID=1131730 RepID=A0AB94IM30_9BACI|nr:heavy metal translocating P-type ATPase [Neobacillus vireti]ETI68070.1 cadmium-transporting ATPase [Neobacillus vireti LMG 21834]KLT18204.1 ATPase [Neobacillus vireti]